MVDSGSSAVVHLEVVGGRVDGEILLRLDPGTPADVQRRELDRVLSGPLAEAAAKLDVVLVARPSAFAFAQPGKDAEGRTRFLVRGRREGDRLVPSLRDPDPAGAARRREIAKRKRR